MKRLMGYAATLIVAAVSLSATAQEFPGKPVRIVVPYPPGGGVDTLARPLAERLSQRWSQPVVVENKPGAATIIGTEFVVKATPDGLTLLLTSDSTITSNPHIFPKLAYDPVKDLVAVTQLIDVPQMVVAHPSAKADSLKTLIELARAKPGSLNYGSYGSGSQPHLFFEGLKAKAGVSLTQVPYKGLGPALTATLAGEVEFTMAGPAVTRGHIQAGKLKPIATARRERQPLFPNVPTLGELGFGDLDPQAWFGLLAPAGTPAVVVRKIRDDIAAIFSDPDYREKQLVQRGFDPVVSTPEDFAKFIQTDMQSKARMIKISGAKAE
jgi:tripartite-type tricarboxylate transporter receptor subunit TctC